MPSVATNTESISVKNETLRVFLDQNDAEVFAAVKNGDTSVVRSKLIDAKNPVNIDAITFNGETALQIATKMGNADIIKVLLTNGADLYTALSQCVLENNLDCIKELLSERTNHNIVELEELIIQAAELGHYNIVYFFLIRKYCEINEPHDFDCKQPCCRPANSWKEGTYTADIHQSKNAINRYKGLSSPVYMCVRYLVSNEDPLIQAFKLNTKVRKRANDEPELKKEYLKLSERCKTFAIDLYNGCRDNTEITALLGIDEKQLNSNCHEKLNKEIKAYVVGKLRDAINSTHVEFVAHPHNQQLLNVAVYSGVSKNIYRMPLVFKIPLFLLYTIIFPLLALLYIIRKENRISRIMTTPYFKFISHISQFVVFLCLVVASALRDTHTPSVLEYLIFITVVGMILQEGIEIYYHKPRMSYFFKWWNIITAIMLILFVLAALSWIVGFAITGDWSVVNYSPVQFDKNKNGYQLLLLGNSFFSLAIVASIFYFFDLCQVNSVLGPLQLSLFRMLQDVLKFLLFFGAIFVAFAMGVRNLYSYYHSIQAEIAAHSNKTENTRAETNHPFSTFSQSTQSMFWALFDKTDLEEFNTKDETFEITQETAKILFGVYSICAIVVALNMLIAMMGHSYDDISQDDDIQWKFSRTQLWLEFIERRSTLPAPYNLLAIPRFLYQKIMRNRVTNGTDEENGQTPTDEQTEKKRRTIMKRLVRRYLRHSQESQKAKN